MKNYDSAPMPLKEKTRASDGETRNLCLTTTYHAKMNGVTTNKQKSTSIQNRQRLEKINRNKKPNYSL